MAIKVGQIRKQSSNYISDLTYEIKSFQNVGVGERPFNDLAINANFEANIPYYVRILLKRIDLEADMGTTTEVGDNDPHNLNIDIKLFPNDSASSKYQSIGEPLLIQPYYDQQKNAQQKTQKQAFINWCESKGINRLSNSNDAKIYYDNYINNAQEEINLEDKIYSTSKYQTIELVFVPFKASQYLVFQLRRVAYDYTVQPRELEIITDNVDDIDVATVNNILPSSRTAKKIGIQSKPGSLVLINNEPMRIGKSGTLEINNGIPITSVGMIAPNNNINEFILDYTYDA